MKTNHSFIVASIWLYFIFFQSKTWSHSRQFHSLQKDSLPRSCLPSPLAHSLISAPNIFAANKFQLEMRYHIAISPPVTLIYSYCSSSHVSGRKMKEILSSYLQGFFLLFYFFSSGVPAGWYTQTPGISFLWNRWEGLAGRTPTIMLRADAFLQVVGLHSLNPS